MLASQQVGDNDGVVGYAARVANGNYSYFWVFVCENDDFGHFKMLIIKCYTQRIMNHFRKSVVFVGSHFHLRKFLAG